MPTIDKGQSSEFSPATREFLAECRSPSVVHYDDVIKAFRPLTDAVANASQQQNIYRQKLDRMHMEETNPIVRAHIEEAYQTLAAMQRIVGELHEKVRQVIQVERQFDDWRGRLESALANASSGQAQQP